MDDLQSRAAFAHTLADKAGDVLRRYFRTSIGFDDKDDASPVTIADREAEAVMREALAAKFPDDGILGEEMGAQHTDARYVWVLDPIDGTKSFISGKPLFGILIGIAEAGRPTFGIIDQPVTRERWAGGKGIAATLNGAPQSSRATKSKLASALLYSTSPYMFKGADRDAFERLAAKSKHPLFGADCYAYGLVASGFADLVCECDLKPYDWCAPAAIIEAAGGIITDWSGQPLTLKADGRVLAAGNAALHREALAVIQER
ncbi:MAG TPA: histidinol-phosphatase [Alphaproteobacteria bacterium]|nr:histidinol-phosphatase [Alphaproteobacteria bacterium]